VGVIFLFSLTPCINTFCPWPFQLMFPISSYGCVGLPMWQLTSRLGLIFALLWANET
jgi:hypothetical protein